MNRLLLITLILAATTALAATQKLQELPLIGTLRSNSRVYVYDSLSGNRNISGSNLKKQINSEPVLRSPYGNYSMITQYNSYSSNGVPTQYRYSSIKYNRVKVFFEGNKLILRPVNE
jgi:hypothetical protein